MKDVTFDSASHLAVILVIVIGSIVLRIEHDISEATLSGILLAALGYATGIKVGSKAGG